MLARLDLRGLDVDPRVEFARASSAIDARVESAVRSIISRVRGDGDAALVALTAEFDGVRLDRLTVPAERLAAALDGLDPDLRAALEFAAAQIEAYHEGQREPEARHERSGVAIDELIVPVDRAGAYVPGGRAAYPSTVLMTAITARVAGVPEVVVCIPPSPDTGLPPAVTLAACVIAGVDEVWSIGGAQAVAAMAYGTDTLRPVDVIVGPGNAYVAEAKRQVSGVVGIDSIAGPSELVVVADATTDPEFVAADLLAQAEHGPGGTVVVVTWHEGAADAVDAALERQLATAARGDLASQTLREGGRIVLVDSPTQAIEVANAVAPEHLQLMSDDPDGLVGLVRHAGAVFVGPYAPTAIGDYVAGANHVLPTGGTARFASALRVATFQKHVHVVRLDRAGLARVGPYAAVLADAEGLEAHARSIRCREADR